MGCKKLTYHKGGANDFFEKKLKVVYAKSGFSGKKGCNYYPFGSLQPGRSSNSSDYRYGFQGQEQDNEVKGDASTSINYKYRWHDTRLGRFLSVDPLSDKYPANSQYAFSENRVIDAVELEGRESRIVSKMVTFDKKGVATVVKTKVKLWRNTDIARKNKKASTGGRPEFNGGYGLGDYVVYADAKTGKIIKGSIIQLKTKNGVILTKSGYVDVRDMDGGKEYFKRFEERNVYNNEYGDDTDFPAGNGPSDRGNTNPDYGDEKNEAGEGNKSEMKPENAKAEVPDTIYTDEEGNYKLKIKNSQGVFMTVNYSISEKDKEQILENSNTVEKK